jgi:hypothetical protein
MKTVQMIMVILIFLLSLSMESIAFTPTPTPTPNQAYNPCNQTYWQIYNYYYPDPQPDGYYHDYNPITVNTTTPTPGPDQLMYKDGFLLKRGFESNQELVLLRGAGTYWEMTAGTRFFDHDDQYEFNRVFSTLKANNINLVRLFIRSGYDPPDQYYHNNITLLRLRTETIVSISITISIIKVMIISTG